MRGAIARFVPKLFSVWNEIVVVNNAVVYSPHTFLTTISRKKVKGGGDMGIDPTTLSRVDSMYVAHHYRFNYCVIGLRVGDAKTV